MGQPYLDELMEKRERVEEEETGEKEGGVEEMVEAIEETRKRLGKRRAGLKSLRGERHSRC